MYKELGFLFKDIEDFHKAFSIQRDTTDTSYFATKRYPFYTEEYNEYLDAKQNKDSKGILDAFIDLAYFCFGTLYLYGVSNEEFQSLYLYEIDKLNNHLPLELSETHLTKQNYIEQNDFMLGVYASKTTNLKEEKAVPLTIQVLLLLEKLINLYEIDKKTLYKAWKEVHQSNMSKICSTEQEAILTTNKYANEGVPCYFEKNNYGYVVKRYTDNKVLKSINYKKVNFEWFKESMWFEKPM